MNENEPLKPKGSKTNVNPKHTHGVGIWNGPRKLVGIRVDENLYKAFKLVAKHYFGSVCRPIESYMATVVTLTKNGVNFGNTMNIEKLIIERNLRPRRKLEFDLYDVKVGEVDCCGLCGRGFEDVFYRIEYISGLIACLCQGCYEIQAGRSVVKRVLRKMTVEC